jgi:hypothetical protein
MILPLYVADVALWSGHSEDYTFRWEVVSFDPIPSSVEHKDSGSRIETGYGSLPRYWIKTPALATIRVTSSWDPETFGLEPETSTNPYGFREKQTKTLFLAGEKVSARIASVVLWCAKTGQPGYAFAEAPETANLSKRVEIIQRPIQEPATVEIEIPIPHGCKVIPIYGLPGAFFDYDALSFEPTDGLVILYRIRVSADSLIKDGEYYNHPWRTTPYPPRWLLSFADSRDLQEDYFLVEGPHYRRPTPVPVPVVDPAEPDQGTPVEIEPTQQAGQFLFAWAS